ncbi:hypothetical protein DFR65_11213 [Oceanihabitans sediminis]|uniref:Uncharacterized protein n=1 Tax=Oceanihabitans sediminis TaxID=1812012 RepID=A0A368P3Q0_9FLAO|nr:hypothetical protein [Oceanihabitans sediminis]RBP27035.1 hypothetical protein DFR65_11213 [Oceanihabitans sediminis]RCU56389.1 hypothetical protein DU428_13080 [Oceanihabitans sediminis]
MKTLLYTIIFITLPAYAFAQNSNHIPFVGNWEWTNGNETFKVELFTVQGSEGEAINGHYMLINNSTNEVIYKSNKLLLPEIDYYFGYAIYAKSYDGILLGGSIDDNVLYTGDGNFAVKLGSLTIILENTCSTCPTTATWEVSRLPGGQVGLPQTFTIPTDIVLTKID